MLKISFPFLYASTSPDTNTFTIASDHNFETVCQFVVLLLSTFCGFSIFATGFAFGFGNFAQYCVVLFTCLQWVTFPKKSWSIIIDVRKSWSIVIDTRRSHCPIDLRFQEVSNLLVWCELFVNLYLGFDFKRITTTLSEFIGHIDLTDLCPILPKHSWNNGKQKCVGKFWYLKYLSSGIHLPNMPCIYLATPILDADI